MNSSSRLLLISALAGSTAVALGAFGAHGLAETLARTGRSATWQTAVHYHLLHAAALLALSGWARSSSAQPWISRAAWAWTAGIGLFSGSLYLLALGGPRWLGPITPLGGLLLLAGWLCLGPASRRPAPQVP